MRHSRKKGVKVGHGKRAHIYRGEILLGLKIIPSETYSKEQIDSTVYEIISTLEEIASRRGERWEIRFLRHETVLHIPITSIKDVEGAMQALKEVAESYDINVKEIS